MIARREFIAGGAALAFAGPAAAQSYPNRPIRLIAPYTAGSPNDLMARLVAQQLQTRLGQPIVVENKPGGATIIGTKAAAAAPPDGYTLLFSSSSLVIEPALHKHVDYDPIKDFTPVAFAATNSWLLTVAADVPVNSFQEFIAYAKANPGKLSFGFAQGTATQAIAGVLYKRYGLDILNVPYKGGALVIPDMLGGRIQTYWPTPATVMPLIREGKLKALATTSPERYPDLPNVPTLRELGQDDLTLEFWAGVWGPAGLPAGIAERLNAAINDGLRTPEMTASMKTLGFGARAQSVQDFSAFVAKEIPRWAKVVRESGVMID